MRDAHELGGARTGLDEGLAVAAVVFPAEGQLLGDGIAEKLGTRILEDG